MKFASLILAVFLAAVALAEEPAIPLWPDRAPGETGDIGEEGNKSKPDDSIIRLGNVSKPSITVFRPPADKDTGAAVVVCPGGGYNILAWNLEGTEICEWLNRIGVTGVLLKYRVPGRKGQPRHLAPEQDAQRAISVVRERAAEWHLDPHRIGILGFSAGGHLAAVTSNTDERAYPAVDAADQQPCRPDFSVLIYPAYLVQKDKLDTVSAELTVSAKTPQTFIAITEDDPVHVEGALCYALALKKAEVRFELHIYPVGGHGYGLRPSDRTVTTWPDRVADWLKAGGWLNARR